jgi:hypothetical protein
MIGRRDRLDHLIERVLDQDRPTVVPGGPGMGKTTLALAAAYDPRVIERFGKRRFFVNLEPAPDADAMLRALAATLGLDAAGAGAAIEQSIEALCAAAPTLAILDNAETPRRDDAKATDAMIERLGAVPGLCLIVTVRGDTPYIAAGAETLNNVESLAEDLARELFLRHAGRGHAKDPVLLELLRPLDGHPLSIVLLAHRAAGMPDLKSVEADWKKQRTRMLKRGLANERLTSLRISIELSLDSLRPGSSAHRLARLVALLPDGLAASDYDAALNDRRPTEEEQAAAAALDKARLVSRRDDRLRLLAPIRQTLLDDFPPEPADRARLVKLFLARAALGDKVGTGKWGEVREALIAEAGNLDSMIDVATRELALPDRLAEAVWGLSEFHRVTGLASIASLPAAAKRLHDAGDVLGEANCIFCLGATIARSDLDGARGRFEAALPLYQKVGNVLGEANCVHCLGDIALERSDQEGARERFEAALLLY